jgi:hypothetical protein
MSSDKQLIANQANARRSTGPRTAAGKDNSRYNALKHGLTGAMVVMPGEDPVEYAALHERLRIEFAPQGILEPSLVDLLATTLWRLQRIPLLESAFLALRQHTHWSNDTDGTRTKDIQWALAGKMEEREEPTDGFLNELWPGQTTNEYRTLKLIGRAIADALSNNALNKLSEYERNLFRQMERLWAKLDKLREQRLAYTPNDPEQPVGGKADAPLTIDEEALSSFSIGQHDSASGFSGTA